MYQKGLATIEVTVILLFVPIIMLIIILAINSTQDTKEYKSYVSAHNGDNSEIYCKDGFLIKEIFYNNNKTVTKELIYHDDNIPTRCGDANITTKETAKTGVLVGSVN